MRFYYLYMSLNHIENIKNDSLEGLQKLKELYLDSKRISWAKVGELGKHFFRAYHYQITQEKFFKKIYIKKKIQHLPNFGTLANPQLRTWSQKLF
jgi:hypothetical protein